jgi:glycosyltransferase involved in cell wall biosynthesis
LKISAYTVVRNEDILMGHLMCHMASIADEVVVLVQPSTDPTLLIARDCAQLLGVPCKVIEHAPEQLGWEFSMVEATKHCKHDWVFCLNADESYVGPPLSKFAKEAKAQKKHAVAFQRWHAVTCNKGEWFKVERWAYRLRLFRKDHLGGEVQKIHDGLENRFEKDRIEITSDRARILEYKAPWQHYRNQLFYASRGVLNEEMRCRDIMPKIDLQIGKLLWERMEPDSL